MANDITIKVGVDSNDAEKGLNAIVQEAGKAAESASQSFTGIFDGLGDSLAGVKTSINGLPDIGDALASDIPSAKNALNSFVNEQKQLLVALRLQGKEGSESYAEIEKAIIDAKQELQKMDDATNSVEQSITGIGNAGQQSGGLLAGLGESLKGAFSGGALDAFVGGGAVAAIQAGVGAIAGSFDAVISGGRELVGAQGDLKAATGANAEEFEALKVSAEEAFLGGVGGSLAEATKAIANAKGALKDALPNDEIGAFVKNAQALGNLYDKDVNEVVNKSAPFIRQFGLEGEKAFNLIAFASKEGKTSQDDVLDTLAEYSQLLQEAGFSAEEFAAQIAVAGEEGLFNTDKIGDSIKEAQIRLKAGDTAKAIGDLQASLPKAFGATLKELEGLASSGQISIKEFLQRSGGAIEEAFVAGDISDAMRAQLQVAIAGTPAEDLGAEAYGRMFGAPIPKEQIEAKALQAGREATQAAGQYLTFDTFTKQFELQFQKISATVVTGLSNAFNVLSPLITFVTNNLGTIATIIGAAAGAFALYQTYVSLSTLATTAYAAVQTALGGTITFATVAQYAYNLAMSLNPIGAVLVAVVALVAGIAALTDAMSESTEEVAEQAQANKELIESQKKTNEENITITKGTKSMADEYIKLSEKKKLTNAESARMKDLTRDLNKQYPDLVKNTGNVTQNLSGMKQISEQTAGQLTKLAGETAKLDKALAVANQNLAYAQRNVAVTKAQEIFTDWFGSGAFTSEASGQARRVLEQWSKGLYSAKTEGAIADLQQTAMDSLKRIQGISAGDLSKAFGFIADASQKGIAALKAFDIEQKATENVTKTTTNATTQAKKEGTNAQLAAIDKLLDKEDEYKRELEEKVKRENNYAELTKEQQLELLKAEEQRLSIILSQGKTYTDFYGGQIKSLVDLGNISKDSTGKTISRIQGTKEEIAKAVEEFEKVDARLVKVREGIAKASGGADIEAFKNSLEDLKRESDSLRKSIPEKLTTKYAFTVDKATYEKEIKDAQDRFLQLNAGLKDAELKADAKQKEDIAKQLEENKKIQERITKEYSDIVARIEIESITDTNKRLLEISLFDLRVKFEAEQEANKGNNIKLAELESAYLTERTRLQEEYFRQNDVLYGIQSAVQMAMMEQFNVGRLIEERRANAELRAEKQQALKDEESDLEKSLADRSISFEEYQAKIAEIQQKKIDAGLEQEKLGDLLLKDLKIAGDKALSTILTDQGNKLTAQANERATKQIALDAKVADARKALAELEGKGTLEQFAKAQSDLNKAQTAAAENDADVYGFRTSILEEYAGKAITQLSLLAASGKVTLAEVGKVTLQIAFELLQKQIPIWVASIFGTEVSKMGFAGIATAGVLTGALYGLFAAAQSAAGFKDGVIALEGDGTETSDSIPAWLSKGESVITARATKNNMDELKWMNETGLPIREFYRMQMSYTSVSEDGQLVHEMRQLKQVTENLGVQITRNTKVDVHGVLHADGNSITAMIEANRKKNSRRF